MAWSKPSSRSLAGVHVVVVPRSLREINGPEIRTGGGDLGWSWSGSTGDKINFNRLAIYLRDFRRFGVGKGCTLPKIVFWRGVVCCSNESRF